MKIPGAIGSKRTATVPPAKTLTVIILLALTVGWVVWDRPGSLPYLRASIDRTDVVSPNESFTTMSPSSVGRNDANRDDFSGRIAEGGAVSAEVNVSARLQGNRVNPVVSRGQAATAYSKTYGDATIDRSNHIASQPLNIAVIRGDLDIVELLLANGFDVNARTAGGSYPGETPLHSVAYAGHARIAELLLAYGADVNATDSYGYTPLRRTVEQGHLGLTELLINKGADVITRDANGLTLLHVVARTDHVAIARLLIKRGVDVNAMDVSGFTPLDYAQGGEARMAVALEQYGAICTVC